MPRGNQHGVSGANNSRVKNAKTQTHGSAFCFLSHQ